MSVTHLDFTGTSTDSTKFNKSPRHLALARNYPSDRSTQIAAAFERGRAAGQTEHWMSGARVGFFCGLLVGLATGCAGAMFWIGFAVRSAA